MRAEVGCEEGVSLQGARTPVPRSDPGVGALNDERAATRRQRLSRTSMKFWAQPHTGQAPQPCTLANLTALYICSSGEARCGKPLPPTAHHDLSVNCSPP